ncbi:WD40-like Beta Propeller Repeat [Paenibacillus sp. UNCCL117]|uniref:S-layer homology domain-containing protein n=1 Tax=unclassified Paenibacillus TaxID=185978 RepID=UPI000882AB53|nr:MULTISPECIES: S-layer homology domain-containing protein [unclassified Paenibacillus]SDC51789.1 WD40-like Beta Propeller Repeat [Paenibacillus sp. cl123]SFW11406.1 WD40-like Beta Propeller Repeat [Paenibacillus sp. UNCCL117]
MKPARRKRRPFIAFFLIASMLFTSLQPAVGLAEPLQVISPLTAPDVDSGEGEQVTEAIAKPSGNDETSLPGEVQNLNWYQLDASSVKLAWEPPAPSGSDNDSGMWQYKVYTDEYVEVGITEETAFILESLEAGVAYRYWVMTIDRDGRESSGTAVTVGISPAAEDKLVDLTASYSDLPASSVAISADGSTVVYTDRSADMSGWELYALDTRTKEKSKLSLTQFGAPLSGEVWDIDVDRTGNTIVFTSNAANLWVAPEAPGDYVYLYNRSEKNLLLLSHPGERVGRSSISGTASLVALTLNERVYAYNTQTKDRILVSRANAQSEDGVSGSPAISGNGSVIAFTSDSSNLTGPAGDGKEHAIYMFETGASSITGRFKSNEYHDQLTVSEDGRYIAYNESAGGSTLGHPYLYDRSTGEMLDLNAGRSETEVLHKAYGKLSLSEDGRFVLAQLNDTEPEVEGMDRYSELFDRQTGKVIAAGNPVMPSSNGVMDGSGKRLIYARSQALYMMCISTCEGPGPEQPLTSAYWTAPTTAWVDGELKPGSTLTIQAGGSKGLSVVADVYFKQGNETKSTIVPLLQDAGAEGLYAGQFTAAEGVTELTGITVSLPDNSQTIALERLPVRISGLLAIEIETEQPELLLGTHLLVTKPNGQVSEIPVAPHALTYSIQLAAGEPYSLALLDAGRKIQLAQQSGIEIANAKTTSVKLNPQFTSSLTIVVNYDKPPAEQATIVFRYAADDALIGEVKADEQGKAQLPGTHRAGERIKVAVIPPVGYDETEPQIVTLAVGGNQISFELRQTTAAVKAMTAEFGSTVGSGPSEAVVMGSEAKLAASAKPGLLLAGELLVQRRQENNQELETVKRIISLTEASSGHYEGVFRVEEGDVRFESVTALVDGEQVGNAYPIGMNAAGRFKLSFELPDGDGWADTLEGASLIVNDRQSTFNYYERVTVTADRLVYTFDVPLETARYQTSVRPANSKLLELSADLPAVRYGETGEYKVKPNFRVQVTGTIKGPDDEAVSASYKLTDESGAVTAQGKVLGRYDIRVDTASSMRYRLTLTPNDPIYLPQTFEFSADQLVKELPVRFAYKDLHPVEGTVLGKDGLPVKDAIVTAQLMGTQKVFKVRTDGQGKYAFVTPLGELRLRASSYGVNGKLSTYVTVPVPEGGANGIELRLLDYATVDFDLYTKQQGSTWQGPLDIDWRVAAHFQVKPSAAILSYGPPLQVAAVAGDNFRVCVNGSQSQLPSTCEEVVIGDDNQAALEIRLESAGAQVLTAFQLEDGSDPGYVHQKLYRYDAEALVLEEAIVTRLTGSYRIGVSQPGRYRLEARGNGGSTAILDFDVPLGLPVDLGVIMLRKPGHFTGQEGNEFTTVSNLTTRDGLIKARLAYKNTRSEVQDAAFTFLLPKGVALLPGTVVVNGKAHSDFVQENQLLIVKVGTIGKLEHGGIRFTLETAENQQQSSIVLPAAVRYSADQAQREEIIGTALVQVAQATLNVPELVVKPTFAVSGSAPANSKITVLDGSTAVATAAVTPEGVWQANITLADPTHRRHSIRTQVEVGGIVQAGQEANLIYDPNDPGIDEVSMRQPDGRVHTFRTEDGVAIFPYVFVPAKPILYELKFRDPARISNVEVWNGNNRAEARLEDGVFKASMKLNTDPGPIFVKYSKKSDPGHVPPPYTDQELRDTLPPALRNFEILSAEQPYPDKASLNSRIRLMEDLEMDVTISSSPVTDYTPTAKDLNNERESGIPLYGFSLSRSIGKNSIKGSISGYIPEGSSNALAAAGSGMRLLEITVDALDKGAKTFDLINALESIANPDGAVERALRLYEMTKKICDERAREYYMNFAMEILVDLAFTEIVKHGLNAAGTIKLPGLPGLILWTEATWAGKKMDEIIEMELNELETYIKPYFSMMCMPPPEPAGPPIAKPGYILDPSGYVYEGLPSNRISEVLATALQWNENSTTWDVWDSAWYEQQNPLNTDNAGRYAWDVPPGRWKVKFEKEGYTTAYSDELEVPPPQLDVNIPMVSNDPPEVKAIAAQPGGTGIKLQFTKPVKANSLTAETIAVTKDGETVAGTLEGLEPQPGTDGMLLSTEALFVPNKTLTIGQTYTVTLNKAVLSYAGIPLKDVFTAQLLIEGEDKTPPAEVTELAGGIAGESASLMWSPPEDMDYAGARIRWKESGAEDYGAPIDMAKDQSWAVIGGLSEHKSYDVLVTAKDEYGNESAGAVWRWVTAEKKDNTAPSTVSELQAAPAAGGGKLAISWRNPLSPDLAKLRISWKAAGTASGGGSTEVAKESTTYEIKDLRQGASYKVFVVAIDKQGNESIASEVTATAGYITDEGETPPVSGGQTPPGGGATPPFGGDTSWKVGKEGGTFHAYEGRLAIRVKPGSFNSESDITYAITDEKTGILNKAYTKLSPTYRIGRETGDVKGSIELELVYDRSVIPAIDTRRFGIYRKDGGTPAGWTYIGGLDNASKSILRANADQWGEYAVLLYRQEFDDMASHWSRSEVQILTSRHIVNGTSDQRFEPDRVLTRAELTKLLVEALSKAGSLKSNRVDSTNPFTDVPNNAWYASYVAEAARLGLVQGDNGQFRPEDPLTREEMMVLFVRYANRLGKVTEKIEGDFVLSDYEDEVKLAPWAREAALQSISMGWITGVTPSELHPKAHTTRAEAAVVLMRVMEDLALIRL